MFLATALVAALADPHVRIMSIRARLGRRVMRESNYAMTPEQLRALGDLVNGKAGNDDD